MQNTKLRKSFALARDCFYGKENWKSNGILNFPKKQRRWTAAKCYRKPFFDSAFCTPHSTFKKAALCCERRPYTSPSGVTPPRSFSSLLRTGNLAAHAAHRLMLLDPSPDMVHGSALRKTRSSTQEKELIRRRSALRRGIHPCCSGLQVQGSAISPAGMAYFHSRSAADHSSIPHFTGFCKGVLKDSRKFHKWVNRFVFVRAMLKAIRGGRGQ